MTNIAVSRVLRVGLIVGILSLLAGFSRPHLPGAASSAFAAPAWNGVPRVAIDYSKDVESWWATHPFNPESAQYAPDIASPSNQVNVRTQFAGNIQAAIDALMGAKKTLVFDMEPHVPQEV